MHSQPPAWQTVAPLLSYTKGKRRELNPYHWDHTPIFYQLNYIYFLNNENPLKKINNILKNIFFLELFVFFNYIKKNILFKYLFIKLKKKYQLQYKTKSFTLLKIL